MRVRVGHISAHCDACGTRIMRRTLLLRITDETVRRANVFLEESRRQRGRSAKD